MSPVFKLFLNSLQIYYTDIVPPKTHGFAIIPGLARKRLRPLAAVDAQGPLEYGNAVIFLNKIKAL